MDERRVGLSDRLRKQQAFTADYSPLYSTLCATLAVWLEAPNANADPLVKWLLAAAGERHSLDALLLLLAGLHFDVLAGQPEAGQLAAYYPSVGGRKPAGGPAFEAVLRGAILSRPAALAAFMRDNEVQTNESGRGLCWLLPLTALPWPAVHLLDLGASAGLNLVAEQRAFRLVAAGDGTALLRCGRAAGEQFTARCTGRLEALASWLPGEPPAILSRLGGDLAPFSLQSPADELRLIAFVWADQPERLERVREGIAAVKAAEATPAPVRILPLDLPTGLADFLEHHAPAGEAPLVIFNTWISHYLADHGRGLEPIIDDWAAGQARPVLWLQMEPPALDEGPAPYGYCSWTADLWQAGRRRRWFFGYAHPHGGEIELAEGLAEWLAAWRAAPAGLTL
ncbi:MAG: DUF2332 family protein [Candidatus Promineifilaceae bacterium]